MLAKRFQLYALGDACATLAKAESGSILNIVVQLFEHNEGAAKVMLIAWK